MAVTILGNPNFNSVVLGQPSATVSSASITVVGTNDVVAISGSNVGVVVETDPVFSAWDKSTDVVITQSQISDGETIVNTGDLTTISINTSGTLVASNLTGSNTGDEDLSILVPYTGATGNINLGTHDLTTTGHLTGILPIATKTTLGVMIAGANLDVDVNGVVNGAPGFGGSIWGDIGGSIRGSHPQTDLVIELDAKASLIGPTFTGTVVLPSTTSIGTVSSTEIGYIDGVTSAIQGQINLKAPINIPVFTGDVTLSLGGDLKITPSVSGAISILFNDYGILNVSTPVNIDGGLHVGGITDAGNDNLLVEGIATILNTTNSALINYGGLQKNNYASQTTGYRVSAAGDADFRSLYVDELHAKRFITDLEQSLAGSQIISKSVAILHANVVIPAKGASAEIEIEDLPGSTAQIFWNNDWVQLRVFNRATNGTFTIANAFGQTTFLNHTAATGGEVGYQRYSFSRASGDAGTANGETALKGAIVLDFGVSGDGFIETTAIDSAGSPYQQIVTWSGYPWIQTVRTRIGNLAGITDTILSPSGYGLYGQNVFLSGKVVATSGLIGGWTIAATTLTGGNAILSNTGVLTLGTSNDVIVMSAADATYRLWAGNSIPAGALFSVTKAGALTAKGVAELGTKASTGTYFGNVAIKGASIWENSHVGESDLYINNASYNESTTYYRNLSIFDGKTSLIARFMGNGTYGGGLYISQQLEVDGYTRLFGTTYIGGATTFNAAVTTNEPATTTFNGPVITNNDVTINHTVNINAATTIYNAPLTVLNSNLTVTWTTTPNSLVISRMTKTQANAMSSKVTGMIAWITGTAAGDQFCAFNGTNWQVLSVWGNI